MSYMQITDLQEELKVRDLELQELKTQLQQYQQNAASNAGTSAHGKASYVCDRAVVVK